MRKLLLFLFFINFVSTSCGLRQDICYENEIYNILINQIDKNYINQIEFNFDYQISDFTLENIESLNLFNINDLENLRNYSPKTYELKCPNIKEFISDFSNKKITPRANGSYMVYNYSYPIELSENKIVILITRSVRNTNYEGGKAMGSDTLYIFIKDKDHWILEDKKTLETY